MKRALTITCFGLLLILATVNTLYCQDASVHGFIRHPATEEGIENADVYWGRNYLDTTDENGYYLIEHIAPGPYSVHIIAEGFTPYAQGGLIIEEGDNVYDFYLDCPPRITVDPIAITFNVEWGGNSSDVITVVNDGCRDLHYSVRLTYLEEEFLMEKDKRNHAPSFWQTGTPSVSRIELLTRRMNNLPELYDIRRSLEGSTPDAGDHLAPVMPLNELDEGPYLILSSTGITQSVLRAFNELEIEYTHIQTTSWATVDFTSYNTVVIAMNGGVPTINDFQAIFDFAREGGSLWYIGGTGLQIQPQAFNDLNFCQADPNQYMWRVSTRPNFNITDETHGLALDIPDGYNFINNEAGYYCLRFNDPEMEVASENGDGWPNLLSKQVDGGLFLAFTSVASDFYWSNQSDFVVLRQIIDDMVNFQMGWLSVEPSHGTIAPGDMDEIDVVADAGEAELLEGVYEALIEIVSSDQNVETEEVWITLTVGSPGILQGEVTDFDTGEFLPEAEIVAYENGETHRSVFTDEDGQYTMFLGTGQWDITADAVDYYISDIVVVDVVEGETTIQNFALHHEIPPEIVVDMEEVLFITVPQGIDSDIMTISNPGGLPLNYRIIVEYLDDHNTGRHINDIGSLLLSHNELDRSGGPDEFGYTFIDSDEPGCPEYQWIDISDTATLVQNWRVGIVGPLPLPFDFPFYGNVYNQAYLAASGCLHFGDNRWTRTNVQIPNTNQPNNNICFFWDEIYPEWGGQVYYGEDDEGNWVTQWMNVPVQNNNVGVTMECILTPDGAIKMQYENVNPVNVNGETIGIENADGTIGLQASFNRDPADYPRNNLVIQFSTSEFGPGHWLMADPNHGVIEVNGMEDIDLIADAGESGLPEGVYEAMIHIIGDHPATEPQVVWATFIVGARGIFNPVEDTGLPYPIIISEATIDNEPIPEASGIAVFDGDLCVGAVSVTGEFPMSLIAWQGEENAGLPGFVFGHEMSFKFWNSATQEIVDAFATYHRGDGTFGYLGYSHISLATQEAPPQLVIDIPPRYFKLISTYLVPENLNAAQVFANVANLVIVYQNNGGIYIPPHINTIGNINVTQGYQLFCSTLSQFTITGEMIDPNTTYHLNSRTWNWLGYPFNFDVPITTALSEIANVIVIIQTDAGLLWIPPFINTIGNMHPGVGYMTFVSEPRDFNYNPGHLALTRAGSEGGVEPSTIEDAPPPTGLPYAILVRLTEEARALNPAIIEMLDENLLVGKCKIDRSREYNAVIAWGGSEKYQVEGFTPGHPIQLVVRSSEGTVLPLEPISSEPLLFGNEPYATVTFGLADLPTEFTVNPAYPNPFNPTVTVPFALPASGEVTFTIFNVLGQRVCQASQQFQAGHHRFVFDTQHDNGSFGDLVSGVYFL